MIIRRLIFLLSIFLLICPFSGYSADGKIGIVLLHGKQDQTPYKISALADRLKDEGYLVETPEMPWSRNRMYDATYEEAMKEIDGAVSQLKKEGAQRIIVGGLSLGGNAALGYAARRASLSGIIVMSPGHFPEAQKFREMSASDITKAKELLKAGKAEEKIDFSDTNMGRTFSSSATVKIYLSYFDPGGPAVVPINASAIRASVPVLWIVGNKDPLIRPASYAFDKINPNPQSKYLSVNAGHLETPNVAADEIVTWVANLQKK